MFRQVAEGATLGKPESQGLGKWQVWNGGVAVGTPEIATQLYKKTSQKLNSRSNVQEIGIVFCECLSHCLFGVYLFWLTHFLFTVSSSIRCGLFLLFRYHHAFSWRDHLMFQCPIAM